MRRSIQVAVLLLFTVSVTPVHAVTVAAEWEVDTCAGATVRTLTQDELSSIRGGKNGGGGGGTEPEERYVKPDVPDVYQRKPNTGREGSYCAFAVALNLQYWVDGGKPSSFQVEQDLEELDEKAQRGEFGGVEIDVCANGGFMYHGASSDWQNWWRSRDAAEDLFETTDDFGRTVHEPNPHIDNPEWELDDVWDDIHGYSDFNDTDRMPEIIVTGNATLHYSLVVGTRDESPREFIINDPEWRGEQRYRPRRDLEAAMSIESGEFDWVGRVCAGDGIYGGLEEERPGWRSMVYQ